ARERRGLPGAPGRARHPRRLLAAQTPHAERTSRRAQTGPAHRAGPQPRKGHHLMTATLTRMDQRTAPDSDTAGAPGVFAGSRRLTDRPHEQVVHVADAETGLRAIIAIHSTTLGPAL